MCNHSNVKKINDLYVCLNCGLTVTKDGKVIFDRKLINYLKKRGKK